MFRAAVLERMPVIEKTPSGHTNGELTAALVKENLPARDQQGEQLLLPMLQPASQVPLVCAHQRSHCQEWSFILRPLFRFVTCWTCWGALTRL